MAVELPRLPGLTSLPAADHPELVAPPVAAALAAWPAAAGVAVVESAMEYGGITPVGLPEGWRLLVPGSLLAQLPRAEVVEGLAG